MKVSGAGGPAAPTSSRPARAGGGFSLGATGSASTASAPAAASSASGVAGLSALMALQGVEDVVERRRRAVRRGRGLLDRLDDIKLAMLDGRGDAVAVDGLTRLLSELRPDADNPGLTQVLEQIDLRARVELAKAEVRRSAA